MAALTGKTPKDTYKDLLQVSNANTGVDGTLRAVEDGEGTSTPLQVSSAAVNVETGFQLGGVAVQTELEALAAEQADISAHLDDTANPHATTAAQVPITDSGANFAATEVESALAEEADARQAHVADTGNPHEVTLEQAGASAYGAGLVASADAATARATLGAAASGANSDITSLSGVTSINGGPLGEQLLIGGDFSRNPWQRGTTFDSSTTPANSDDTYLADQVILLSDGNDIVDVTQDADGSLKCTVATANKQFGFVHIVEAAHAQAFLNDVVSAAVRAKSSGLATLRLAVLSWTGTADSVTSDVVGTWAGGGTEPTWATNWTREGTIADLSLGASYATAKANNIDLDTASAKQFAVVVWVDDTDGAVSDTLNIAWVSCVHGSSHPDIPPRRHPAAELELCLRYAEAIGGVAGRYGLGRTISTSVCEIYFPWKARKRVTPAISLATFSDWSINDASVQVDFDSFGTNSSSKECLYINVTAASSTLTANRVAFFSATGTTPIIASAEL